MSVRDDSEFFRLVPPSFPVPLDLIQNTKLSPEAKCLLIHICSLPHFNRLFAEWVHNTYGWSRQKTTLIVEELIRDGYARQEPFLDYLFSMIPFKELGR